MHVPYRSVPVSGRVPFHIDSCVIREFLDSLLILQTDVSRLFKPVHITRRNGMNWQLIRRENGQTAGRSRKKTPSLQPRSLRPTGHSSNSHALGQPMPSRYGATWSSEAFLTNGYYIFHIFFIFSSSDSNQIRILLICME
jgi:hypothetical protein